MDDDDEVTWHVATAIGNIEACILELGCIDPTSMAFRYPVDKENVPFLQGLSMVNLHHFGDEMNNIANYLEAVAHTLLSELGKHVLMAELGFNDKLTEDFRKHMWLKRQKSKKNFEYNKINLGYFWIS